MCKWKKFILVFLIALTPTVSFSQVRESALLLNIVPTRENCDKISDITSDFAENAARSKKVAMISIRYIRTKGWLGPYCQIVIDSANGPLTCNIDYIFSVGGRFFAGGPDLCY